MELTRKTRRKHCFQGRWKIACLPCMVGGRSFPTSKSAQFLSILRKSVQKNNPWGELELRSEF